MFKSSFCLLALMVILASQQGPLLADMPVKALTFNIRYGTANDGQNAWPHRRQMVADVIRTEAPDFCGIQEALRFQLDAILQEVPAYGEYGCGREDGKSEGEFSSILYRKDRWQLQTGDTVWLSDTPQVPGSASWGNRIPRIVTWARFSSRKADFSIYVFNTHFDHRSQVSRVKSAEFLCQLIADKAGEAPLIVTGDFNAGEDNPAIKQLTGQGQRPAIRLVDTFRVLHPQADDVGTFNGFQGRTSGEKIDYVFTRPATQVRSAEILQTNVDGRYPSDHFPVSATLVFPAKPSEQ